jgi:hypothetical protein
VTWATYLNRRGPRRWSATATAVPSSYGGRRGSCSDPRRRIRSTQFAKVPLVTRIGSRSNADDEHRRLSVAASLPRTPFSRFLSVLCDLVVLRTQQPPSKFSAMSGRKPDCFYGGRGTSRVRAYEKHGRDRFLPRADSADFCFRPTLRTQRRRAAPQTWSRARRWRSPRLPAGREVVTGPRKTQARSREHRA